MLQIKDIFQIDELKDLKIIAGHHGTERNILSVTIMDIPEIADWLTGEELVISGVLFRQCFSKELIDAFIEKNIAGIVTKEKFLSADTLSLLEYCNEKDFPILIAPVNFNWGQIMNPVINQIVRKPYLTIEENQKFHYSLMRSMIGGGSLSEICSSIYESTKMNLAISDNDLHLIGFSDHFAWRDYTRELTKQTIQYTGHTVHNLDNDTVFVYSYSTTTLNSLNTKLLLFPIILNHVEYGYIVLASEYGHKELSEIELTRIQQLSLFVALHFTKQDDIANATRRYQSLLLDELLNDTALTAKTAELHLSSLGKKLHRNYYVLYMKPDTQTSIDTFLVQNSRISRFHSLLESTLSTGKHILLFEKNNDQVLLLPFPYKYLSEDILIIRNLFLKILQVSNVYIGISQPLPLEKIAESYKQAKSASAFLFSSRKEMPYMEYQNLGMLRYFMDNSGNLDMDFLREIFERYITPLKEYDQKHNSDLLNTLQLYLANNASKTKTEKILFIHKNTLRARLDTINKILDINVDSLEDSFHLLLALKLQYLFE